MSFNDQNWSVFWASEMGDRRNPPTNGIFNASKHIGEDPNTQRAVEKLGYVVIEKGTYSVNGLKFTARVGDDIITGINLNSTTYPLFTLPNPYNAVLSSAGMDGGDGGWPVLYTNAPVSQNELRLIIDEDMLGDYERGHTHEQVAHMIFNDPYGSSQRTSETEEASEPVLNSPKFNVFPNPARETIQLAIETGISGSIQIQIPDINGRTVQQYTVENLGESQQIKCNISQLAAGMYFIRAQGTGFNQTIRFIKQP